MIAKKHSFFVIIFCALTLLFASDVFGFQVTINISPTTLNLDNQGQWIQCNVELPFPYVFADIDQDGLLEIILFSDHEQAGNTTNRGNSLWVVNPDMSRVSGFEKPLTTSMPLYTGYENNIVQVAPSPCIVTYGHDPRIVVPSYDGYMRCYSKNGVILWQVQFDTPGSPFIGASEAGSADLDDDHSPEIIFTTYSTQNDRSDLVILSLSGSLLHRIPLIKRGAMSAPSIGDIDNDGVSEIVISLKDVAGNGAGGVQIWDVPSARNSKLNWFTGRGNYLRTGENTRQSF